MAHFPVQFFWPGLYLHKWLQKNLSRFFLYLYCSDATFEPKDTTVKADDFSIDRANWKQIARTATARSSLSTFEESCKPGTNPYEGTVYYVLFQDEPYCIFEGAVYSMLPVAEPSLGYKLISASIDRKTILARSNGITENQAISVLFALPGTKKAKEARV